MRLALWPLYCLLALSLRVAVAWGKTAAQFLEEGKRFLASKEYEAALNSYSEAVALDPDNYMNYFQRATAYLAIGSLKNALQDFTKVSDLRPGFVHVLAKQSDLQIKLGLLEDAMKTLEAMKAKEDVEEQIRLVRDLQSNRDAGFAYMDTREANMALQHLNLVIEHVTHDEHVRMARAHALMALGRRGDAINDVARAVRLTNDNTEGYLALSKLYYENGQADKSLAEIRECLKLDPDHKECFAHYKVIKKLHKAIENAEEAVNEGRYADAAERLVKLLSQTDKIENFKADFSRKLCTSYLKLEEATEALKYCTQALELQPDDKDLLCDRAEAHILHGDFEKAGQDYHKVLEEDHQHHRAREGQQRVEQLKKQAKKRDYYKILGVKRTATKKEIMKAYRRLALEWHPDKHASTPEEKEMAEKMFMDISDAKEVLTDEEMRQKFDQGIDPLDAEQNQGHGHHPHAHHFNPFNFHHGGGQQFHFRWG